MNIQCLISTVSILIASISVTNWNSAEAQQEAPQYPDTGGRTFSSPDAWAVSRPNKADKSESPKLDMSPDHWGSSASSENPNSYRTKLTSQAWDGTLENHPWLDSDTAAEEAIVKNKDGGWQAPGEPTRAPTMSIGSNDDTNFDVPMPPSMKMRRKMESDVDSTNLSPAVEPKIRPLPGFTPQPPSNFTPHSPLPAGVYPLPGRSRLETGKQRSSSQIPATDQGGWKSESFGSPSEVPQSFLNSQYNGVQSHRKNNHGISYSGTGNPAGSFRPDLGQRSNGPTYRQSPSYPDDGQQYGYEKKQYPPMREILATGRNFGSVDVMLVRPNFQGNTAFSTSNGIVVPIDYDYRFAWGFELGFESSFGPGAKIDYFQYDQNSNVSSFVSDGITSGTTRVTLPGTDQWNSLTAANGGETLNVNQSLDVQMFGASFFKEMKFPVSRLNAYFGIRYASIAQQLESVLTDAGGAEIGRLLSTTDMRAYGPNVGFEYFRPVGHTRLEIISAFGGAILMGRRDQFVQDSVLGDRQRVGADEFVSIFDISAGVQSQRYFGENRCVYWKVLYVVQTWNNGGNAANAQESFGFRGIAFTLGFNR